MRKLLTCMIAALAAIAFLAHPPGARATPLPAPSVGVVPSLSALGPVTVLADTGLMMASSPLAPDFRVELQQLVIQETLAANPLGGLTFAYQVKNASTGSGHRIARVTTVDFNGWTLDVNFTPGATPPWVNGIGTRIPLAADRNLAGGTIGLGFGNSVTGIAIGETSQVFFLRTDAPEFKQGSTFAINGGTAEFRTYAPTATSVVPEPATMLMMGTGVMLFGCWSYRKRKPLAVEG